ncbi:MAG: pyruvate flavodoxin oxidoreductase subunit gamma [Campylobacterales bacterium]|nr:pyruvate flavodoxin oxidoreductase subunit gamma [Campylobacterales bacterium]
MLEIRWHSRAGQGAVTGVKALCDVMAQEGKHVQGFSVYGAEKRGAPMNAFNRISEEEIIDHSKAMIPDYVLIIDPSLVYTDVFYDTNEDSKFIVTTHMSKEELFEAVPEFKDREVYVVDGMGISTAEIGRAIPNTPMLGAFISISKLFGIDEFAGSMEKLLYKFPQPIIDGNVKAIKRAFAEVN